MLNWGGIDEDSCHRSTKLAHSLSRPKRNIYRANWLPVATEEACTIASSSDRPTELDHLLILSTTSIWIQIFTLWKIKPSQYPQIVPQRKWTQISRGEKFLKKTTLWDCRGEIWFIQGAQTWRRCFNSFFDKVDIDRGDVLSQARSCKDEEKGISEKNKRNMWLINVYKKVGIIEGH